MFLVLWIRSSQKLDVIYISLSPSLCVYFGSFSGTFDVGVMQSSSPPHSYWQSSEVERSRQNSLASSRKYYTGVWGRFAFMNDERINVFVPNWFLIGTMLSLAAAPWVHWSTKFSLRTLLITTTLVAAVLGLIVWSIKR